MYTGHFGVALASAGLARRVPLALLILATFACDIIEGFVALNNINDRTRVMSHSLPVAFGAGVVLASLWMLRGGRWLDGLVIVVVASSHTALDFVTGVKEWWPGEPLAGWNLYQRPWLDGALEAGVCLVGWGLWMTALPPAKRRTLLAWAPLVLLLVAQFAAVAYHEWFEVASESGLSKFIR
jgi:hypothetical protein